MPRKPPQYTGTDDFHLIDPESLALYAESVVDLMIASGDLPGYLKYPDDAPDYCSKQKTES
jgi:hypothetical protein